MNFEEWYKVDTGNKEISKIHLFNARAAWLSCKQEVLKIIEDYNNEPAFLSIKERIEKEI